jgi:hypothetical protein
MTPVALAPQLKTQNLRNYLQDKTTQAWFS